MLSIAFGQSKYYVDNLSENVKRGIRQKLRRGIWPKQAPFGYVNNPKTKALDINPEQAKVVKRAFEMFAEGNRSFVQIDDFLFDNGIMAKSGRRFHLSGVKHLLTNTFYVGIFRYSGELYQGSHKTFISKALFQKVQERIKKIERPRRHGHNFAFIGLARCGQCGGAITAESHQRYYPQTGRHVEYIHYRCTKKLGPCSQPYLPEADFETQLRQILLSAALPKSWQPKWQTWLAADEVAEKKLAQTNLVSSQTRIEELDKKQNLLLDTFLDGTIDQEMFKTKKNEIFEEKLKIQQDLAVTKAGGSTWLETMREFVKTASGLEKIARAKKNLAELRNSAKKVGSNYFLEDRHLRVVFTGGFAALCTDRGVHSAAALSSSKSLCAGVRGIGPLFELLESSGLPLTDTPSLFF